MSQSAQKTSPSTSGTNIEGCKADPLTGGIHAVSGGFAAVMLAILVGLTVVDVVGRYFFNAPIPGGYEITQILMAAIIFGGLPAVSRLESHITVDLLDGLTPHILVPPRQVVVNAACASVMGIIGWRLWLLGDRLAEDGDVTEYLRIPSAPTVYIMSILKSLK